MSAPGENAFEEGYDAHVRDCQVLASRVREGLMSKDEAAATPDRAKGDDSNVRFVGLIG